jgi:hypothetical protein
MAVDQLLSTMPEITLEKLYKVQFEAISPTTGLAVTGVTVGNVSLTTLQAAQFEQTTPVPVTPLWVPIPLDDQ